MYQNEGGQNAHNSLYCVVVFDKIILLQILTETNLNKNSLSTYHRTLFYWVIEWS